MNKPSNQESIKQPSPTRRKIKRVVFFTSVVLAFVPWAYFVSYKTDIWWKLFFLQISGLLIAILLTPFVIKELKRAVNSDINRKSKS